MSWQTYVDDHLMVNLPCGHTLKSSAICGLDGGIWAQSSEFPQITDDQISILKQALELEEQQQKIQTEGFHIGETKFIAIRGEKGAVIRGRHGNSGCVIKKTSQALVMGLYETEDDNNAIAGDANVVVEQLGDYLMAQGF